MKRIFTLLIFAGLFINAYSSHLISTHIQVTHQQGFDYELKVFLYTDPQATPAPQSIAVSVYQRQGASFVQAFNLPRDTFYATSSSNVGCPPSLYAYDKHIYTSVITLSPTTFNDPGGYLFVYSNCCRSGSIHNIQNSAASGSSGVLLFPPVVDASGNQILNSSPVLNDPINEVIVNQHPFYNFYGGYDPDGDSLAYHLVTPFGNAAPTSGIVNPLSAPYPDPSTQISGIMWSSGYSANDQVHGMGTNPSPDRFLIDPQNGVASLYADETAPGYVLVGIWCQEFRNGALIGSTFRDFVYYVSDETISPNQAPDLSAQLQSLASWNGDTLEFSGSPVCVQLSVTDADTIADISLIVSQSDYDDADYNFVQSSTLLQNQDTFVTALCFQPDSFLSYPSRLIIVVMDEKCYESTFDTLDFYIRFNGYSNAGNGGTRYIPLTPGLGSVDLFTYLNGNPNPGGTWLDLDNTGLLSNGIFDASGISTTVSYRFGYVDQQPNYPADTSELHLEFFVVQGLDNVSVEYSTKVYPNPNTGNFVLETGEGFIGRQVNIYSLQSRLIESFTIDAGITKLSIKKTGMYLLKIEGSDQILKIFIEN